jgi:hypothetical protein
VENRLKPSKIAALKAKLSRNGDIDYILTNALQATRYMAYSG